MAKEPEKNETPGRFRAAAAPHHGFTIVQQEPVNLEMPFGTLDSFITSNERFYVRCHFPIPQLDAATWRLELEGEIESPLSFSLAELKQMPSQTVTSLLECAGNGRVFLNPKVKGAQWQLGAVGNARWTGVRLSEILQRAKLKSNALEIILEGADHGEIKEPPRPAGEINYARSIPLTKAMEDVILAYEMNGAPLSDAHGAPLRAIVPGWYGMASVKWLTRILVTDQPFQGFYQTIEYTRWQRPRKSLPAQAPLAEVAVKAQISRPEPGELLRTGEKVWVQGAAWTSQSSIAKVEISVDGGASWRDARLLGEPVKNSWQFWEYEWLTPSRPGRCTLLARASDAGGRVQPLERDFDHGTYMIDHSLPIEVELR